MFHSTSLIRTARFATSSNGAGITRARSPEGLTVAEIERVAPSVFATSAHDSRSDRFVPIATAEVLQGLMAQGFVPMEARQGGSRDKAKRNFTKHMIRFRHAATGLGFDGLGGLQPEIILVNGNDGTSSYQIMAGMFRMVCTNGLIAGDITDMERIRHTGRADQVIDNVIDASFRVIDTTPIVIDNARHMGGIALSEPEQTAFARAALQLRWDGEGETAPIQAHQILRPQRQEDRANDLFTTMNVIQEALINGGQRYRSAPTPANPRGQRRETGAIGGIDQNKSINRALWTLANEMAALKQAA